MITSVLLREKRPIESSSTDWRRRAAFGLLTGALVAPLAFAGGSRASAGPIARSHPGSVRTVVGRRPFPNLHGLTRPWASTRIHMSSAATTGAAQFCNRLWTDISKPPPAGAIYGSTAAQSYCFGPQFNQGNGLSARRNAQLRTAASVNNNVDAANPNEDITQAGVRAYGQSETSSAAIGDFVVEAWNDSTGFFAPCPSPNNQEELSGYGFSNNNGASFLDLGGLPNAACASSRYDGDTGVEAYRAPSGSAYFYITNIFTTATTNNVALAACKVNGVGAGGFLTCSQPDIVASASNMFGNPGSGFLDKPYVTIDQQRGLLYVSYTDFETGPTNTGTGQIQLATCNLAGNPDLPGCTTTAIVAPEQTCDQQGSYPAADAATGDVYVAYEFNYVSGFSFAPCNSMPTQQVTTRIPLGAGGPIAAAAVNIVSEETAFVPGYNRFPVPDFPRIAVSDPVGTVSIVWNDTRYRPTGDILLQSYDLGSAFPTTVQNRAGTCTSGQSSCANPVRLSNNTTPTFNLLPALRNAEPDGTINVSWYDKRRSPPTDRSFTDVYGALDFSPRITQTPSNTRVTNVGTSWLGTSSDIVPNFGDYTDNHVKEGRFGPTYTRTPLFVSWSDGRIGEPQPFSARISGI